MPLLSRAEILQADDLKTEDVEVPEWGGTVRVRELSGTQRDQVEAATIAVTTGPDGKPRPEFDKSVMEGFRARLAALSIVDENGGRIFSDADMAALGQKSSTALQRVYDVAVRLSAFSAADVEELTGNSAAGQSAGSSSASASPSA